MEYTIADHVQEKQLPEVLAEYGKGDWELVSTIFLDGLGYKLFFKRPEEPLYGLFRRVDS